MAALMRGVGANDASRTCQHHEWSTAGKIDVAEAPGGGSVDGDLWRDQTTDILRGVPDLPPLPPPVPEEDEPMKIVEYGGNQLVFTVDGSGVLRQSSFSVGFTDNNVLLAGFPILRDNAPNSPVGVSVWRPFGAEFLLVSTLDPAGNVRFITFDANRSWRDADGNRLQVPPA